MVTTTTGNAGAPSQPTNHAQSIDDFRSLLAACPPAKADALKERIYDWLEKRERDAETTVEKAKARAAIVEEQNRIVRMELQVVEEDRMREDDAVAVRKAKAGLFAEVMSALNAPDAPVPMEGTAEEENDDPGMLPTDYQQPTDSSVTAHPLQPLGANIAKKVHAGDVTVLDMVIKELLDEVMELREGASANVARIVTLEEQLQSTTDALATQSALLDEALSAPTVNYSRPWGGEMSNPYNASQPFSSSSETPAAPLRFWGEEKEEEPNKESDVSMRDTAPSPRSWSTRLTLRDEPAPIRGYLDENSESPPNKFDACFKQYANMMLFLQLKANDKTIAYHEIPWPVLPYTPDDPYPVPRWRARYAEKEDVDKFVEGFLASKHAEVWRGSMRDDWLDLLEFKHDDTVKEIVETMVGHLNWNV